MENTLTKSSLYFALFTTLIIVGYVVGLMTLPTIKPVIAIRNSTIAIDGTETIHKEQPPIVQAQQQQDLPPLPTQEVNPFNGGKIVDIPRHQTHTSNVSENNIVALKQDPRITIIPQTDTEYQHNNPMGYTSDTVEIEMTGEEPISELEKKNIIDDLSTIMKKKSSSDTSDTPQKNTVTDPYAPRIPLLSAPQAGYYKKSTSGGLLPQSPQGQQPLWQLYSNPTKINPTKKPIAFVLGGLGTNYNLTVKAIKTLPPQVTLGFIPYVKDLQKLITLAREYGHETVLEIPMETHDFPRPDAGLLALRTTDTKQEHTQKLETLLSLATGYSGVMNYLGSKYVLNNKVSLGLLNDLKEKGLYFVENKTIRTGILSELAVSHQIPYGASFDIIDEVLSPSMVNNSFSVIEKNTLLGTPMIATAYLSDLSLGLLKARIMMYEQNPNNDIQLVPISRYIENN